jgi:hypothetical protein
VLLMSETRRWFLFIAIIAIMVVILVVIPLTASHEVAANVGLAALGLVLIFAPIITWRNGEKGVAVYSAIFCWGMLCWLALRFSGALD